MPTPTTSLAGSELKFLANMATKALSSAEVQNAIKMSLCSRGVTPTMADMVVAHAVENGIEADFQPEGPPSPPPAKAPSNAKVWDARHAAPAEVTDKVSGPSPLVAVKMATPPPVKDVVRQPILTATPLTEEEVPVHEDLGESDLPPPPSPLRPSAPA